MSEKSFLAAINPKNVFKKGKKGLNEGFRRLGLISGLVFTAFTYDETINLVTQITQANPSTALIWTTFAAGVILGSFFVVAISTRIIGWVFEGFSK